MRGDLVRKLTARCLTIGLAVLAFLLLALTGATGWGLALAVAALAAAGAGAARPPRRRRSTAEIVLLLAGILVGYARRLDDGFDPALARHRAGRCWRWCCWSRPLRRAGSLEIRAANLPVRPGRSRSSPPGSATPVAVLLTGIALARPGRRCPPGVALLLTLLVAAGRRLGRRWTWSAPVCAPRPAADPVGRGAASRHQPEFVLYFSAPAGSEYQATMWLPYLERIGRPFMVLVREPEFLAALAAATTAPVVHCPTLRAMDEALVPSLRVAFYVNHGAKNSHCLPVHPADPHPAAPRRQRQGAERQPALRDLRQDLRGRAGGRRPVRPRRRADPARRSSSSSAGRRWSRSRCAPRSAGPPG